MCGSNEKRLKCIGSSGCEEEPAAHVRVVEHRLREQRQQHREVAGAVCARVVPRRHAGEEELHSTGTVAINVVRTPKLCFKGTTMQEMKILKKRESKSFTRSVIVCRVC